MTDEKKSNEAFFVVIRVYPDLFEDAKRGLENAGLTAKNNIPFYFTRGNKLVFSGEIERRRLEDIASSPWVLGVSILSGKFENEIFGMLEGMREDTHIGLAMYMETMRDDILARYADDNESRYTIPAAIFLLLILSIDRFVFMELVSGEWEQAIENSYSCVEKGEFLVSVPTNVVRLLFTEFFMRYDMVLDAIHDGIGEEITKTITKQPLH